MKFSSSLNDVTGVQSQAQSKKLYAAKESRGTTIKDAYTIQFLAWEDLV